MNTRKPMAFAALCAATCAFGAFERTIPSTDGMGDVVALTNALAELNALSKASGGGDTLNARIYLSPGLYDLKGVRMAADSHLRIEHARNLVFAGLGDGPSDTVLLGGGEADGCRVISGAGGGNYWWNTYSNLTVTGGWMSGSGAGIYSGSLATRYVCLIVSNNVSTATERYMEGGGVCGGVAERCLFADNRAGIAGGAFGPKAMAKVPPGSDEPSVRAYATDCTFSNNQVTASYSSAYGGGAVTGGTYTRCRFYGNRSATYGGAVGRSEQCPSAVLIDCELVGNVAKTSGGAVYRAVAMTNCTLVGNSLSGWGYGGAIEADASSPTKAVGCVFTGNAAALGCVGRNVDFTDCVITNHQGTHALLDANLTRCYVADNVSSESSAVLDYVSSANSRTNANCVFVGNRQSNYGPLSGAKVIVNCAYFDNAYGNSNYSPLFSVDALVYNSVFAGNMINGGTPCDIRTSGNGWEGRYPTLVNCVFATTDGDVEGVASYTDCRQMARERLRYTKRDASRPLMPSRRSPLYNGGYEADWLLALVGDKDFYGRTRQLFERIDIGPAECDIKPTGMIVLVK